MAGLDCLLTRRNGSRRRIDGGGLKVRAFSFCLFALEGNTWPHGWGSFHTIFGARVGVNYFLALIDSETFHFGPCSLRSLSYNLCSFQGFPMRSLEVKLPAQAKITLGPPSWILLSGSVNFCGMLLTCIGVWKEKKGEMGILLGLVRYIMAICQVLNSFKTARLKLGNSNYKGRNGMLTNL
jgi:hypothetical protein